MDKTRLAYRAIERMTDNMCTKVTRRTWRHSGHICFQLLPPRCWGAHADEAPSPSSSTLKTFPVKEGVISRILEAYLYEVRPVNTKSCRTETNGIQWSASEPLLCLGRAKQQVHLLPTFLLCSPFQLVSCYINSLGAKQKHFHVLRHVTHPPFSPCDGEGACWLPGSAVTWEWGESLALCKIQESLASSFSP